MAVVSHTEDTTLAEERGWEVRPATEKCARQPYPCASCTRAGWSKAAATPVVTTREVKAGVLDDTVPLQQYLDNLSEYDRQHAAANLDHRWRSLYAWLGVQARDAFANAEANESAVNLDENVGQIGAAEGYLEAREHMRSADRSLPKESIDQL